MDLDQLEKAVNKAEVPIEVVLKVSIGHYVAFEDTLAAIWTTSPEQSVSEIAQTVREAVAQEQQRDLDSDPAYGIEQLAVIGWTSVSTAKSNSSPGVLVLHSLRDILACWSAAQPKTKSTVSGQAILPVVYSDVFAKLLNAFETLSVVAFDSMQPQTMTEFFRVFALMFERLPVDQQPRAEDLIRRSLSALGEHVLTAELNSILSDLAASSTRRNAAPRPRGHRRSGAASCFRR